jgi:hypothetical protein
MIRRKVIVAETVWDTADCVRSWAAAIAGGLVGEDMLKLAESMFQTWGSG